MWHNWQELMVVHGILDQSQGEQFVRINKAFLGEQDALVMASISDSSNYNPSDLLVRLIKMRKRSLKNQFMSQQLKITLLLNVLLSGMLGILRKFYHSQIIFIKKTGELTFLVSGLRLQE